MEGAIKDISGVLKSKGASRLGQHVKLVNMTQIVEQTRNVIGLVLRMQNALSGGEEL